MTTAHLWMITALVYALRAILVARHAFPDTWKKSAALDAAVVVAAAVSLAHAALS
ncbi:hypothetical protein ACFQ6B_23650 [Streptomyces wedmorensis]|uniref:Uncharacterized protein n=1 Tax=Streptomyces wedmorensis TaxID=43759 RepID=A0ABW6J8Y2_STRWE